MVPRVIHRKEDRMSAEMMIDVKRWPFYPYLPLTHRREKEYGMAKCGLLVAVEGYETTVILANMCDAGKLREVVQMPKVQYDSLTDLMIDWQVD
jgi:hypothetical protein